MRTRRCTACASKAVNAFVITGPVGETLTVNVNGDWALRQDLPSLDPIKGAIFRSPDIRRINLVGSDIRTWDTALLAFIMLIHSLCREHDTQFDTSELPVGVRTLLDLALAAPGRTGATTKTAPSFVSRLGSVIIGDVRVLKGSVTFLGDSIIAFARLLRGRARCRATDLFLIIQECGAQALPIVSVISLLVGMIFAFVGAVQLRQFGADIYDANLVAVAMAREMAAVMTGIVLAGRTGAAFAAQIGAMQGNEEIDALSTLGISPMEFLVLPRMLALILMTPLLCVYSNAVGIFGGFLVGVNTLNVTPMSYLLQTQQAVTLGDFSIGIVKGSVFGALIAVTGCFCGIASGRSAAAVGAATTSAVVFGILAIIVTDAIFAVLLDIIGL